jgi:hypothetical protein
LLSFSVVESSRAFCKRETGQNNRAGGSLNGLAVSGRRHAYMHFTTKAASTAPSSSHSTPASSRETKTSPFTRFSRPFLPRTNSGSLQLIGKPTLDAFTRPCDYLYCISPTSREGTCPAGRRKWRRSAWNLGHSPFPIAPPCTTYFSANHGLSRCKYSSHVPGLPSPASSICLNVHFTPSPPSGPEHHHSFSTSPPAPATPSPSPVTWP